MKEHLEELKLGGRPMTKLEKANKEIERLNNRIVKAINLIEEYIGDFSSFEAQEVLEILKGE